MNVKRKSDPIDPNGGALLVLGMVELSFLSD